MTPLVVLLLAVACSGAAGLTYQVLWLRQLSLVFGVTAYAASTVLAGFMAGLALGSLLAGRTVMRARRPLRWFAGAEVAIALTALASLPVLVRLPSWYAAWHGAIGDDFGAVTLTRFLVALAVLVVPTSIMGATLPLLAASAIVRADHAPARVSAVYAANTAGAIVGALATGMSLIGAIGVSASFLVAAGLNLAAAVLAFGLTLRSDPLIRVAPPAPGADALPEPSRPAAVHRAVLLVLWISGLASLALEVIWFRILVLFIPATTYAFTTMLAAVLLGIAGGGWIAAVLLAREREWLITLLRVQAATAVTIPLSLVLLASTYARGWTTSGQIQVAVVAILPAALLMGMAFPLGVRLCAGCESRFDDHTAAPREVGLAYAVNVMGAIVGALLGGFVLLPELGSRLSLLVCAGLYLVCAVMLARVAGYRRAAVTVASAVVLFTGVAMLVPDPFLATLARRHGPSDRIVWREEGVQTTVSVHQQPRRRYVLYLDGLHQANDSPEMLRTHREIGHLPMVLHPNPERALVIGLGGGATPGAVSRHASTVDIVELSDSVRKAAALFAHANYNVLAQPHVRLRVDDGRNYLLTTRERYDVITADIIQPEHAGAGLVYSAEYFGLARKALDEDGVMLQWIGHRPALQYRLLVRAFLAAFPETTLWNDGTLLVGSKRPLVISRSAFERQQRAPRTREALDAIGLRAFEDLTARFVAGPAALRAFVGEGEMLSDDRPRLEFHRSLPRNQAAIDLSPLLTARAVPPVGH
jgi:spermidine synthase